MSQIAKEILEYNSKLAGDDALICDKLMWMIYNTLSEARSKIWHGAPVWFLDGNPIVGYDKLKDCVRLLFWSGQSFDESNLSPEWKFKAAEKRYSLVDQIDEIELKHRLEKAIIIQRDYKNIVKRQWKLEKITQF